MGVRNLVRLGVEWAVAAGSVMLLTLLLGTVGADSTSAGMAYLVVVVLAATLAGFRLSLAVAAACALLFDFFFLMPYHSLLLGGAQEWVAFFCFLLCCLIVGRVAKQARQEARQAEQRREDVERLYTLSQDLILREDADSLIRDLPGILCRVFDLEAAVIYVRDREQCFTAGRGEMPESLAASMKALALGMHPMTLDVPGGFSGMALMLGLRAVGAMGWRPAGISTEVATAVGAQVAIVLTRALALEASAHSEAVREGERLRTALVDSLTHELRTPLTSIRAAATTMLETGGENAELQRELAQVVDEESARLNALIGEAVEMAEVEANSVEVHLVPQRERVLLEQALEHSARAVAGARCRILIADEESGGVLAPPAWFDAHLLSRVLRHLLENAGRFTPPGGRIELRSWRHEGRLEFCVEDSGPGVDAADSSLIFEKFYRGKNQPGKSKGTGMGLAIVRAILLAHGGGIEVENAPEGGARFRFWVPLVLGDCEQGRHTELDSKSTGEEAGAERAQS